MKKRSELKLILCCTSLAMVAGCGGGGGYGGGVASSSNYVSTFLRTPNVTGGNVSADVLRVTRTFGSDFQITAMSDATTATDTINITFGSDSTLSNVTFSNNLGSASFNSTNIGSTTDGNRLLTQGNTGTTSAFINSYSNYMDYGYWQFDSGNTSYQSFFVSGAETSYSSLPTSGTATYTGKSIGIAYKPLEALSSNTFLIDSDISVTADFGAKFVGFTANTYSVSNMSNATVANQPAQTTTAAKAPYNFTGIGNISSTNSVSGGLTLTNSGQTGVFTGKFYGPSAENIGGTFTFSGTSLKYTGSFGAAK